jgi:hypothetical protein
MSEDVAVYAEQPVDLRYAQVSDDSAWHLVESTFVSRGGNFNMLKTRCGITSQWNSVSVDRLPGGDEESCENCLLLLAGDVDAPKEEKPKKKAAAKK